MLFFADFAHDNLVAREVALRLIDETELTGWGGYAAAFC